MTKMRKLAENGQSIWYDYIRRTFLVDGELEALLKQGLRGMTSNPSIFEKAIAGSSDYDEQLRKLVAAGKSRDEIYQALATKDIAIAADLMQPVYEETNGLDGYVSLEVSPTLAHDTEGTIAEAKALYESLGKANVMIKVPATAAGIPAIKALIAAGVSINVTLIFSVKNYHDVAEAYIAGLEELHANGPTVKGGQTVATISSVASFFVSRVDKAVDAAVVEKGRLELKGKIAIANAKVAYRDFAELFSGDRWNALSAHGAKPQRLLWASTSTKDPSYSETLYVDELIGAQTVNTIPPKTLNAWLETGSLDARLGEGIDAAERALADLDKLGVDIEAITTKLQDDGVASFAQAFESLMNSIEGKRERLLAEGETISYSISDEYKTHVDAALNYMRETNMMRRIWKHDHTVWSNEPTEITNRLGWLQSPEVMENEVNDINAFVEGVKSDGFTNVLLLGMGGSSLAPELFRLTFGVKEGHPDLAVLDSTDPGVVLGLHKELDLKKTLFVVATKSGGTAETLSFFKYFYNETGKLVDAKDLGKHFVAITDPGSKLEKMAGELNFRKTFLNDPNIGGRYSALSFFGLVPAALVGVDIAKLLDRASIMACNCEREDCSSKGDNTGAILGVLMGQLGLLGRDKITLISSPPIAAFGAWVEQLIAESTGKEGKGILPVDGEHVLAPDGYADDRLFAYLRLEGDDTWDSHVQVLRDAGQPVVELLLEDVYDVGAEFFRWEVATAIASAQLQINPFDQPNVESAKILARDMVAAYLRDGKLPEAEASLTEKNIRVFSEKKGNNLGEVMAAFLEDAELANSPRAYIALQAYVPSTEETDEAVQGLRSYLQQRLKVATTVGYGPRFLHSTGQLHKGDAGNGLFIQITADMPDDVAIPDEAGSAASGMSFGVLKMAQAQGDLQALVDGKRPTIRIHLGSNIAEDLRYVKEALRNQLQGA
ncbi:MAG: bifunctional transaldolase/phosoglucose isomerase [Calditrichia bacterium]